MTPPLKRSRNLLLPFSYRLGVLLFLASLAWGQKDMGNIVGTVKDPTGAVVADAKVTVTDVDRGTSVITETNATGEYVSGPLRIGRYNVSVEKAGFENRSSGPLC